MIGICEMCGKETKLVKSRIESSTLLTCDSCSRFGTVIDELVEKKEEVFPQPKESKTGDTEETTEVIVEDYSQKIKQAREARNLKQKRLAETLAIKESIIHKLESGKLEPSLDLARKLEKFLNIKLIQLYVDDYKQTKQTSASLTIGDMLTKDEK